MVPLQRSSKVYGLYVATILLCLGVSLPTVNSATCQSFCDKYGEWHSAVTCNDTAYCCGDKWNRYCCDDMNEEIQNVVNDIMVQSQCLATTCSSYCDKESFIPENECVRPGGLLSGREVYCCLVNKPGVDAGKEKKCCYDKQTMVTPAENIAASKEECAMKAHEELRKCKPFCDRYGKYHEGFTCGSLDVCCGGRYDRYCCPEVNKAVQPTEHETMIQSDCKAFSCASYCQGRQYIEGTNCLSEADGRQKYCCLRDPLGKSRGCCYDRNAMIPLIKNQPKTEDECVVSGSRGIFVKYPGKEQSGDHYENIWLICILVVIPFLIVFIVLIICYSKKCEVFIARYLPENKTELEYDARGPYSTHHFNTEEKPPLMDTDPDNELIPMESVSVMPVSNVAFQDSDPNPQYPGQMRAPQEEEPRQMRPPREEEPRQMRLPREEEPRQMRPPREEEPRQMRPPREEEPRVMRMPREEDPRQMRRPREEDPRQMRRPREEDPRQMRRPQEEDPRQMRGTPPTYYKGMDDPRPGTSSRYRDPATMDFHNASGDSML